MYVYTKSLLQIHQFILESNSSSGFFFGRESGVRALRWPHQHSCAYCGSISNAASHGRRPDMQLQEVQKEAEHSGLGHLLLTYPLP